MPARKTKSRKPPELIEEVTVELREGLAALQRAREAERQAADTFEKLVHRFHKGEGWSTYELADMTGLSRTRMVQMVDHQDRLAEEAAEEVAEAARRERKRVHDAAYRDRKAAKAAKASKGKAA